MGKGLVRLTTIFGALMLAVACSDEAPPAGGGTDGSTADATAMGTDALPTGIDGGNDGGPNTGDGGPGDTGMTGPRDTGMPANPNNPNNPMLDSDCDGLSDAYEFSTIYANGMKTSPSNSDSDGDGLTDGQEVGVTGPVAGSGCASVLADADPASRTLPVVLDTDGDGIADGLEDANHNGRVDAGESNPNATDSDGDGIPDAIEDANLNGLRDGGELDPSRRDTDGDGIGDGIEDTNKNGVVDPGETNPLSLDTDGDTLMDGDEDTNHDGIRQSYEVDPRTPDTDCDGLSDGEELMLGTSPLVADTDRDGIPDGVELGRTMPLPGTNCPGFVADADPTTMTNPTSADTDGDGVPDGVEDANQDGAVAVGTELDPNNADTDGDTFSDGDELLIGSNPLDPNSPDTMTGSGIQQICSNANLQPINFNDGGMADWTVAVPPAVMYQQLTVNGTDVFAASLDNAATGLAGIVVQMPLIGGAGATSAAQDTAFSQRLGSAAMNHGLNLTVRQSARNIQSHDGFETAASAVYGVSGPSENPASVRNKLVQMITGLGAADFTGLVTTTGNNGTQWVVMYQLLVRPADNRLLIVAGVLARGVFEDAADNTSLSLSDLTGGTALALKDAARDKGCDPFQAQGDAVADFIWMADISASTDDDRGRIVQAAEQVFDSLANNGVDFRMGVVPHTQSRQHTANPGALRGGGFTRDRQTFRQHLENTSGEDGCEYGLSAVDATIARSLPRTAIGAPENPTRLRGEATLAVVYVSDEHAQTVEQLGVCDNLPAQNNCPTGIDDVWNSGVNVCNVGLSAAQQGCVDQLVQPYINALNAENGIAFGQVFAATPIRACNSGHLRCQGSAQDRNEPGRGYIEVINGTGGLFYSPCDANPGAGPLMAIVDAVTGAASQFQLSGAPIASTLKVGISDMGGMGMVRIVPRDKQDGFDYDPASNSIFFRGNTHRPNQSDRVTISYRVWNPPEDPCGPCAANQVCDPQLGVCTCDSAICNACGPNQACDADCNCACTVDCNGNCGVGEVCNQNTCMCECAANCGGACPSGTTCNQNSCACECDTDCGGACAGTLLECNQQACNCQCPTDCGGACVGANSLCNASTCACDCGPACNDMCSGNSICNPANNCQCECPTDCGGCPDGTMCNAGTCECQCPMGCNDQCVNNQVCDPQTDCTCICPSDCGGCAPNETCNPIDCQCVPVV